MNDNELSTMVRESVADVHSATKVDQVISRGRAVRARRRTVRLAAAPVVAAGTALAVAALLPSGHAAVLGSHHPASPANARLAAWTVAKQANCDIDITIHQLRDPSGLQATLRADGLPANVTFSGPGLSASCQPYFGSLDVLKAVAHLNTSDRSAFLVINPSALPSGAGVGIFDEPGTAAPLPSPSPGTSVHGPATLQIPAPNGFTGGPLVVGLVSTSPQCTG